MLLRQRLEFIVVAVDAREAGSGSLVEGYAEFHLRHRVYDRLVDIFNSFDEMSLPEDEVAALGNLERHEREFHTPPQDISACYPESHEGKAMHLHVATHITVTLPSYRHVPRW